MDDATYAHKRLELTQPWRDRWDARVTGYPPTCKPSGTVPHPIQDICYKCGTMTWFCKHTMLKSHRRRQLVCSTCSTVAWETRYCTCCAVTFADGIEKADALHALWIAARRIHRLKKPWLVEYVERFVHSESFTNGIYRAVDRGPWINSHEGKRIRINLCAWPTVDCRGYEQTNGAGTMQRVADELKAKLET